MSPMRNCHPIGRFLHLCLALGICLLFSACKEAPLTGSGLVVKSYWGNWSSMPDFNNLNPNDIRIQPNLDINERATDAFAAVISGIVSLNSNTDYRFHLTATGDAKFYLDNTLIIDHQDNNGATTSSERVKLTRGDHQLRIEFLNRQADSNLQLEYQRNDTFLGLLTRSKLDWARADIGDKNNVSSRIVGGQNTTPETFPFRVPLLTETGNLMCAGAILNARWILTAAHCSPLVNRAQLGPLNFDSEAEEYELLKIVRKIDHPDYQAQSHDYDFALHELEQDIDLSQFPAVALPLAGDSNAGQTATVVGWGDSVAGFAATPTMTLRTTPLVSNSVCNGSYKENFYDNPVTENMLCAGIQTNAQNACQGDSGGPLLVNKNGNYRVIGVTSWGVGCTAPYHYGVYARVDKVVNWIQETITSTEAGATN